MKLLKTIGVLCGLTLASPALSAVLDFESATCFGGGACTDGAPIDQSYGDMTGVDVIYDGDPNTAGNQNAFFWANGYGTLENVAYGHEPDLQTSLTITFNALAGWGVRVLGFDFAGYTPNPPEPTQVQVFDTGTNGLLFSTPGLTPFVDCPASTCSEMGLWESSSGISIVMGPDAYNTGIDNIIYETYRLEPIPLPASGLLLLGGLFGLSRLKRRK